MSPVAFVATLAPLSRAIVAHHPFTTTIGANSPPQFSSLPRKHASLLRAPISNNDGAPPRFAPARPSRILLWLDAHLRVHDNAALAQAARDASRPGGTLVPLRVDDGARSRPLAAELAADLQALGSDLVNVRGDPCDVLPQLCKKLKLDAVYYNRRGGTGVAWKREQAALRALRAAGVQVHDFEPNALPLVRGAVDGDKKLKWGHVRGAIDTTRATDVVETPHRLPALPSAASLVARVPLAARRGGGTSAAVALLKGMRREEEMSYARRGSQLAFRLKLFLDYGCVSTRVVAKSVLDVVKSFAGCTYEELVWRTFLAENVARIEARSAVRC